MNTRVFTPRSRSGATLTLFLICAFAAVIRTYVAFSGKATWYNTDTRMYLDMADAITNGRPMSTAPNGYPLLIVLTKWVVGAGLLPAALIGLNVLFSAGTVLLCYGIGSTVGSRRAGLLAAVAVAVWPNQINYMRQILTEAPATFFLMLGFWLVVRERYLAGGASLYVAALIRSTLLPVAFLVLLWMVISRKNGAHVALYTAGLLMVFLLNFTLVKLQYVRPPANAGEDLLIAVQAEGADGINFKTDTFTPDQKAHPVGTYLSFLATSPGVFVRQRAHSLWELWGPWPEAGDHLTPRSRLARLIIGLRFPLVILALVGFYRRRWVADHWLLIIPVFVVTAVHVAFFSTPRFSYCAEPCALLLGALLASHLSHGSFSKLRDDPCQPLPSCGPA